MLESQRIQERMSKLREQNQRCMVDAPADGLSPAASREVDNRTRELADLETKWRAALQREQELHADGERVDGETRELERLCRRASVGSIISAFLEKNETDGAEREAQQAASLGSDGIPWAMLAEPVQARQDADAGTPASVGTYQRPIIERVFARTATAALGTQMPSAGVGDELFYVTTAGASPSFVAGTGAKNAEAFTLSPFTLEPERLTAAYLIKQADTLRIRGYEASLRGDFTRAMGDALDKQLIGPGDAVVRGYLATPANGGIGARAAAGTEVDYSLALAESALAVDGIYAAGLSEAAWVVGDDTYRKLATLINTGSGQTSIQYHMAAMRRIMGSANVPAPASDVQEGIISRMGRMGVNAVCPVWGGGLRIIRDEVTQASTGRIRLTVLAFYDFRVLRPEAFQRTSLKLA